ncbi:MAG: PIN domain nuclease [Phenylobacterium zucineum]|nr:MAG: PIN domain nuclease [Phenylobacterium zucineum]
MVVDASALVAIAELESDAEVFAAAIANAESAVVSQVNALEAAMVLLGRKRFANPEDVTAWREGLSVSVWPEPVDDGLILSTFWRFGKGRHPARLNLGDCFAYALARTLDAPLLYKGDDFALTDARSAL